ncbi:hypothetical protein [Saccharopolyspora pogona]|uniref:hypothetical protein n=1 Tax=Saccharopolyspora pogona TaxID=333966 RepID=UPI001684B849|nr:hypothetical protein [Saccharopolyspora pogona]
MSLLDRGNEMVTIYPEIATTDRDGNTITKADFDNPVTAWVRIQPAAQSGTSARRAEQDNEGYESEETYKLRFARGQEFEPGAQAQLDWAGRRWSFYGYPQRFNGSAQTRRLEFTIRRT